LELDVVMVMVIAYAHLQMQTKCTPMRSPLRRSALPAPAALAHSHSQIQLLSRARSAPTDPASFPTGAKPTKNVRRLKKKAQGVKGCGVIINQLASALVVVGQSSL
jgi:hypothetical protein